MHNESETACNLGPNQSSNMDVNQKNRGLLQANSNNADNKNIRGRFIIACTYFLIVVSCKDVLLLRHVRSKNVSVDAGKIFIDLRLNSHCYVTFVDNYILT